MPTLLVLASASRHRRSLLERLRIPFVVDSADIDESLRAGEPAQALAERLSAGKAEAVARRHPAAVVVGSDQVAVCRGEILGKPGTAPAAVSQLRRASGQPVRFFTAVCVIRSGAAPELHVDTTTVCFRTLTEGEIERYVALEQPLDCAGSFRAESLGVALFERIETEDPTALVGLPLIWLSAALRRAGIDVP